MKILVTGGTGFTGKRVLPLLKGRGEVVCLIRSDKQADWIRSFGYEPRVGDVENKASLIQAMQGCQGLINIVSIGFGHAANIVEAAETNGVRRALFVSTTALETKLAVRSRPVRLAAEACIHKSVLDYTILRPTMIFGGEDDRNIIRLARYLNRFPVVPVPGRGTSLQQPVFVDDLAWAIVEAFFSEKTKQQMYRISGAEAMPFNSLLDQTCEVLNRRVLKIHLPVKPMAMLLRVMGKFSIHLPVKEEQILRLVENKDFSHDAAQKDFAFFPRTYKEGLISYLGTSSKQ